MIDKSERLVEGDDLVVVGPCYWSVGTQVKFDRYSTSGSIVATLNGFTITGIPRELVEPVSRVLTIDRVLKDMGCEIHFLNGRYGDGVTAFICAFDQADMLARVTDDFTAGDPAYDDLHAGLLKLSWYPVAYGETFDKAITELRKRLALIRLTEEDQHKWRDAIHNSVRFFDSIPGLIQKNPELINNFSLMPYGLDEV